MAERLVECTLSVAGATLLLLFLPAAVVVSLLLLLLLLGRDLTCVIQTMQQHFAHSNTATAEEHE